VASGGRKPSPRNHEHVSPAERVDVVAADPDDNRVLECAIAAGSEVIVSGDSDLLQVGIFQGIAVMTVSAFLARFEAQKP
jgi:predicted nucleic acid-binding protein